MNLCTPALDLKYAYVIEKSTINPDHQLALYNLNIQQSAPDSEVIDPHNLVTVLKIHELQTISKSRKYSIYGL